VQWSVSYKILPRALDIGSSLQWVLLKDMVGFNCLCLSGWMYSPDQCQGLGDSEILADDWGEAHVDTWFTETQMMCQTWVWLCDHFQPQFLITCNNRGTSSYLSITRDNNVQGPLLSFWYSTWLQQRNIYLTSCKWQQCTGSSPFTLIHCKWSQRGSGSGLGMRPSNQSCEKNLLSKMCSFWEETSRPYIHCDCCKFSRQESHVHIHTRKLATHIVLRSS